MVFLKKILLSLLCVAIFALPVFAAHKNEPAGFRGIPWYASPKDESGADKWGLSELSRDIIMTTYVREKEQLTLGAATIESVHYLFLDEVGLVMVDVLIKGKINFNHIRKACTANWGEPAVDDKFAVWQWDTTRAEMFRFVNGNGKLRICVKKFPELVEQQEKKAIQKSQKDFQENF